MKHRFARHWDELQERMSNGVWFGGALVLAFQALILAGLITGQ
jgi:hypothetical protein